MHRDAASFYNPASKAKGSNVRGVGTFIYKFKNLYSHFRKIEIQKGLPFQYCMGLFEIILE